jgi:cyanate lyase
MLKLLKKLFVKQHKFDKVEELINHIIIGLLEKEKTEAMTAPISGVYYITNEKLNYYVRVDSFSIIITNHKFTFKEGITSKFSDGIISIIKEYMEMNRKEFENKVFNNQIQLLTNIKNNLL